MKSFTVVMLLSFVLTGLSSHPLYSQEDRRVAIVSLSLRQGKIVESSEVDSLKKSIKKNLPTHPNPWSAMDRHEVQRILIPALEDSLNAELQYAKDAYYSFQFGKVQEILLGRLDPDACVWRSLAYFSENKKAAAQDEVLKFLMFRSPQDLSKKEFSPKFLDFVGSIQKVALGKRQVSDRPLINIMSLGEKRAWQDRWQRVLERVGLGMVMVLSLEQVGWNRKLQMQAWSAQKPYFFEKNIELVSPPDWPQASKILVNTVFSVDTLPHEK